MRKKISGKIKEVFNTKGKSNYYILNLTLIIIIFVILLGMVMIYFGRNLSEKKYSKYLKSDIINKVNFYPNDTNTASANNIATTSTVATTSTSTTEIASDIIKKDGIYAEVIGSCDIHFGGYCVRARNCPSLSCPTVANLRDGMVLRTDGQKTLADGITWYHIYFDEWVRYPDRTAKDWYISADFLKIFDATKERFAKGAEVKNSNNKEIIVNLTKQKLYAYEGDTLFLETSISSGLDDMPTPRGTFHIYEKTPSRYMQGPLPGVSDQEYDLPGVPWTMYFTYGGAAIHGAYWHDSFGTQWSHGCVNLKMASAEILYRWADLGTTVIVKD